MPVLEVKDVLSQYSKSAAQIFNNFHPTQCHFLTLLCEFYRNIFIFKIFSSQMFQKLKEIQLYSPHKKLLNSKGTTQKK